MIREITAAIERAKRAPGSHLRGSDLFGFRNLLSAVPEVRDLAIGGQPASIAHAILGEGTRAVRGLFLDKTRSANWRLGWHRDQVVAVSRRAEVSGFRGWSTKDGVLHALAPAEVLADMVTVRLHLDPAEETSGALKVVPGSHARGLDERDPEHLSRTMGIEVCEVRAGDIVVMSPLLVHSSEKCRIPKHRRVVHIEYSAAELPAPLQWKEVFPVQLDSIRSGR